MELEMLAYFDAKNLLKFVHVIFITHFPRNMKKITKTFVCQNKLVLLIVFT